MKKKSLIWQYLKTTKNDDYSRSKSLDYLKGKSKKISALVHLSSIAWHYLKSYCNTYPKCSNAKLIIEFIKKKCNFVTENELEVDFQFKKKSHKMIGNTPFTSLHICYWLDNENFLTVTRVNKDALVCVMICFGPKESKSNTFVKFKDHNSLKESQTKLRGETIYVYWPRE